MINFLTLKPEAIGLDISDLSLKIIKLKKRGKFLTLANWGKIEMKPGIIYDGAIQNQDAFSQVLKDIFKQIKGNRVKTNNVVVSVTEKKSFSTVIQMPKMQEEEFRSAIPFEAENHIPLSLEESYLDFQVIPSIESNLDHNDVLLVAFPRDIIDDYIFCLKKAGLSVVAIENESQSISRALIKNEMSPSPVLIVDFGGSLTNLIIFSGYSVRFTSSIAVSSSQLTEAISQSLNINFNEAEGLKIDYGLEGAGSNRKVRADSKIVKKNIFDAMTPVLLDLSRQIKRYLIYYQSHSQHEHLSGKNQGIEKVILCGRGANLKGLANFLALSLKLPVELGNPWINILPEPLKTVPEISYQESLGYTAALGLALRGANRNNELY